MTTPPKNPGRPLASLLGGFKREVEPAMPAASHAAPRVQQEPPPSSIAVPPALADGYQAFLPSRVGHVQMIEIRRFAEMGSRESYVFAMPQFVEASFIDDSYAVLKFTSCSFEIEGSEIHQLIQHLKQGHLSTIQQWRKGMPEPADGQPKITRIDVRTPEMVLAQEQAMRERNRTPGLAR